MTVLDVCAIFGVDFVAVSIHLVDRVVIKYFDVLGIITSVFVVLVEICIGFVTIFGIIVVVFVGTVDFADDFVGYFVTLVEAREVFFTYGTLVTNDLRVDG